MSNESKVKSLFIVEVKYKTKYKKFVTISLSAQTNFIIFKGIEVIDEETLLKLNSINNLIEKAIVDGDYTERYFPWSSVIEIQVKRYKEQ